MLELVIAVVVAFVVGLLIGVTSMTHKVREAEHHLETVRDQLDEFKDTVYNDVNFQSHVLWCGPLFTWPEKLTNTQRKRLRRLGAKLLRIKDTDEDHPNSVES